MDWVADREMAVYQTIFSMSSEASKLDRFERRFAWFRGRLDERREIWALFPPGWRVPQTLCLTFCKITKARRRAQRAPGGRHACCPCPATPLDVSSRPAPDALSHTALTCLSSPPRRHAPQAALKRILSDSEDVIASDVAPLLKTVVATNKFERDMAALFGGGKAQGGGGGGGADAQDEADELQVGDAAPWVLRGAVCLRCWLAFLLAAALCVGCWRLMR